MEEIILSFLSMRELVTTITYVNKWFREAANFRWNTFQYEYQARFLISPFPIYLVKPSVSTHIFSRW